MSQDQSDQITDQITHGDLSVKPGWVRWSLHPTTTNEEVKLMITALKDIVANYKTYAKEYVYIRHQNFFKHKNESENEASLEKWIMLD